MSVGEKNAADLTEEEIKEKAANFGRQVREFEKAKDRENRSRSRRAWELFLSEVAKTTAFGLQARKAYFDEYLETEKGSS